MDGSFFGSVVFITDTCVDVLEISVVEMSTVSVGFIGEVVYSFFVLLVICNINEVEFTCVVFTGSPVLDNTVVFRIGILWVVCIDGVRIVEGCFVDVNEDNL